MASRSASPNRMAAFFILFCLILLLIPGCVQQQQPSPQYDPQPQDQYNYYPQETVTVSRLNVRNGPSTSAQVLGTVYQGDVVTVLVERGDWKNVRTPRGLEGWVASKYLSGSNQYPYDQQDQYPYDQQGQYPYDQQGQYPYDQQQQYPYNQQQNYQDRALIEDIIDTRFEAHNEYNTARQMSVFTRNAQSSLLPLTMEHQQRQIIISNVRDVTVNVNGNTASASCVVTMSGLQSNRRYSFTEYHRVDFDLVRQNDTWKISRETNTKIR